MSAIPPQRVSSIGSANSPGAFRCPPSELLKPAQYEEFWAVLKHAIDQIHANNAGTLSFETLYRYSYNLVVSRYGAQLYANVSAALVNHLDAQAQRIIDSQEPNDNDLKFLRIIVDFYDDFKTTSKTIADIFMYLDRTYCRPQRCIPIFLLAIELFCCHLLSRPEVTLRITNVMLRHILLDRQTCSAEVSNNNFDACLLKRVVTMLAYADPKIQYHTTQGPEHLQDAPEKMRCEGQFYRTVFETPFLRATSSFYAAESADTLSSSSLSDFLHKAQLRFQFEADRAQRYLHPITFVPLRECLISAWVIPHAAALIQNSKEGCVVMFDENRVKELSSLYIFLARNNATLTALQEAMKAYLLVKVDTILRYANASSNPVSIVNKLLKLKSKFHSLIETAFFKNPDFFDTLRAAFKVSFNRCSPLPHYICRSLDQLVRKHCETQESDIDSAKCGCTSSCSGKQDAKKRLTARVSGHIALFRHLEDKDVFEAFYCNFLANRLLSFCSSDSEEIEQEIIACLKLECGQYYTSRMEEMLNDVKKSRNANIEFQHFIVDIANREGKSFPSHIKCFLCSAFSVSVLTTSYWPLEHSSLLTVSLPTSLSVAPHAYQQFYASRHTGRKLTWLSSQGTGELRGVFAQCKRDFLLSVVQMLILLLCNEASVWSYKNILARLTPNNKEQFNRLLLALCANSSVPPLLFRREANTEREDKVVKSDSAAPGAAPWAIDLEDQFELNHHFYCRHARICVPSVSVPPFKYTSQHAPESLEMSRVTSHGGTCTTAAACADFAKAGTVIPTKVEEERRIIVDAAIVRIMKQHKMLPHNQLMCHVTELLKSRFHPKTESVEARIKSLVERDFLACSAGDAQIYSYIA